MSPNLPRRLFSIATAAVLAIPATVSGVETLYNGIVLPDVWPPRDITYDRFVKGEEAPVPPYLVSPPAVIPIDVGRQLFVDDFLIEASTLKRVFHQPEYYAGNPVVTPDRPWEWHSRTGPMAMPFSGGVFWDPRDSVFKMWYMAGYGYRVALAISKDGLHWEKPDWGVLKGTSALSIPQNDMHGMWLDLEEKDPERRYKMVWHSAGKYYTAVSADGLRWNRLGLLGKSGDRCCLGYNPFRKVWVYSLRHGWGGGSRARRYAESPVFGEGAWNDVAPPLWTGADRLDGMRPELKTYPQLYNLDCAGYESVMIGLFTIYRGSAHSEKEPREAEIPAGQIEAMKKEGRPKLNSVSVGFSRDGFNWSRPDRTPFLPVSEQRGAWNWGNVQSAGGCCVVMGDHLYFYVSGRAGLAFPGSPGEDSGGSTGVGIMRRDGFASLEAGPEGGSITTRPVSFSGRRLFVNVDAPAGELLAELLDRDGKPIEPFTRANCEPVKGDSTLTEVKWTGAPDLAAVAGTAARLRFHLTSGKLYAFWVSADQHGASGGYLGGGGPGYTSQRDTVGRPALEAAKAQTAK